MQGQDAVNTAQARSASALPLTGIILTKLDGDARGGAALSVRHVTGKPIKFAGIGEKLDGLEAFHPERMAAASSAWATSCRWSRRRTPSVDLEEAKQLAEKVKKGKGFDLEDFKQQLAQMKKMGGVASSRQAAGAARAQMHTRRSCRTTGSCGASRASSTR